MSDYKAKNSIRNIKFLFQERARYYATAYEGEDKKRKTGIFDINNFESVFVGRMDPAMNAIFPKQSAIKNGTTLSVRGVNFAVDAFEAFRSDFQRDVLFGNGAINFDTSHPFLSKITVYKSYHSPSVSYEQYISSLMGEMIQQMINNNDSSSIPDFSSYVNYFLKFLNKKGPKFPFTQTGWQKSVNSDIFTSGLAFSIANLDCGDDTQKEEFFNDDNPNFLAYRQTAMNHGFVISLQCPWIMIASPEAALEENSEMVGHLAKNNILGAESVYEVLYNQLYLSDIYNLKNILINNYNQFVQRFPIRKKLYFSKTRTSRTNHLRTQINSNTILDYYTDLQFQILYATIRNIEEGNIFVRAEFDRLKKNATFFYKNVDSSYSLSYINKQFINSYSQKHGGINDYYNKKAKKDNSEE